MSVLAATTIAALLIASPSQTDADRLAAYGGFLLGSAQRCGVEPDRIVRAARLVRGLIAASADESRQQEEATTRFAQFFLVSAFADPKKGQPVASCPSVVSEFARLEAHKPVAEDAQAAIGDTSGSASPLGAGE